MEQTLSDAHTMGLNTCFAEYVPTGKNVFGNPSDATQASQVTSDLRSGAIGSTIELGHNVGEVPRYCVLLRIKPL